MKHLDKGFELKEVTATGAFCGYGSVFDVVDGGDDVVAPGAFKASLDEYAAKNRLPALLWQHDRGQPIGAYQSMKEDSVGLYLEGKLALKTQKGAEALELMQMGAISGLSIGFMSRDDAYDQKTGVRTIKQADLWEVSLVTFPMNDAARVTSVKAAIDEITDFKSAERYLRDAGGFSRSEALALVARVKSLTLRDAVAEDETKSILQALRKHAAAMQ